MPNHIIKANWINQEEMWTRVMYFPGFQISSRGNIRSLEEHQIELWIDDKHQPCAKFEYFDSTTYAPIWRHMLHNWYEGNTDDVWFEYLDGDVGNLDLDNLIPVYMDVNGDIKEISWRPAPHGLRILDRRMKKMGHKVEIIETGDVFDSVDECAQAIGGYRNLIYKCLKGTAHTHMGYTFKYVE